MCNLNSLNDVCVLFIFVEGQGELPESKYLRVENKVFYFDVGSNSLSHPGPTQDI
jgi:hypothetical protein